MKNAIIAAANALLIVLPGVLSAQVIVSPPPRGSVSTSAYQLVTWSAGPATCNGLAQAVQAAEAPDSVYAWLGTAREPFLRPVTARFRIDATGRTLDIATDSGLNSPYGNGVLPALAATRFAPGAARTECSITFTPGAAPVASAPISAMIAYTIWPHGTRLPHEAYARIAPTDTDCIDPSPEVLARAFPDFQAIEQAPGSRAWSMVGYDIDRQGRAVRVHLAATTGNAALDRASIKAVQHSRFKPGVRHGCVYPYWRSGGPLAPPPIPEDAPKNDPARCPVESDWSAPLRYNYPDDYRRLRIEGWAIISYDVAPWGQTGNIKVLMSQPTAEFGTAASNMIRAARKREAGQGFTGCVSRVRYNLSKPGERSHAVVADGDANSPAPF